MYRYGDNRKHTLVLFASWENKERMLVPWLSLEYNKYKKHGVFKKEYFDTVGKIQDQKLFAVI